MKYVWFCDLDDTIIHANAFLNAFDIETGEQLDINSRPFIEFYRDPNVRLEYHSMRKSELVESADPVEHVISWVNDRANNDGHCIIILTAREEIDDRERFDNAMINNFGLVNYAGVIFSGQTTAKFPDLSLGQGKAVNIENFLLNLEDPTGFKFSMIDDNKHNLFDIYEHFQQNNTLKKLFDTHCQFLVWHDKVNQRILPYYG
jgi:hypothetical protein